MNTHTSNQRKTAATLGRTMITGLGYGVFGTVPSALGLVKGPYSQSEIARDITSPDYASAFLPGGVDYKLTRRLLSTDKSADPRPRYLSESAGKYTSTLLTALAGAGLGAYAGGRIAAKNPGIAKHLLSSGADGLAPSYSLNAQDAMSDEERVAKAKGYGRLTGALVGAGIGGGAGLLAALAGRALGQLRAPRTEKEQDKHNASTLGMALNYIVPGKGSYERGRRSRYAMAQDKIIKQQINEKLGLQN